MACYNRGVREAAEGNAAEAFAQYDAALRFDPTLQKAYVNRGALYSDRGHVSRAKLDLEIAVKLDAEDAVAWTWLGIVEAKQGDMAAAQRAMDAALALKPDDQQLRSLAAEMSAPSYTEASALDHVLPPNPSSAAAMMSRMLELATTPDEREEFARLATVPPDDPDARPSREEFLFHSAALAHRVDELNSLSPWDLSAYTLEQLADEFADGITRRYANQTWMADDMLTMALPTVASVMDDKGMATRVGNVAWLATHSGRPNVRVRAARWIEVFKEHAIYMRDAGPDACEVIRLAERTEAAADVPAVYPGTEAGSVLTSRVAQRRRVHHSGSLVPFACFICFIIAGAAAIVVSMTR
jgi:hypothetical protein